MRRRAILIVATCLAILAGVLPLVAIYTLSRQRAVDAERSHLTEYANWTLMRAGRTLSLAQSTLEQLDAEHWNDCSPAHILRMRQMTVDATAVEEIGFYKDGMLTCTSWGPVRQRVPEGAPDERLPDGLGLYLGVKPVISRGQPMMVVSLGAHNALVKPERLVDVLSDTHMTLGVATEQGRLIALSGAADPALIRRLTGRIASSMDDRHLFAASRASGLIAFAISDRTAIRGRLDRELGLLVPMGLLVSAILIGVVIWVSRQRLSPQRELEIAIRKREFVVHYQPIIALSSGLCVGAEALLRWRRPEDGWIPPDIFIPIAEQSGQIDRLTDLMIDRVVDDMAGLLAAERKLHVSINISAEDMESGRFLPILAQALRRSGISPTQIWLEATERSFMNAETARETIEQVRAAGHPVAIDDFGTGYSSLSLLETLPLDALKIDKSFIAAIGKGAATSVVTPHITEMAHGLRFLVIAEGVETPEQEAYIRALGVEFAQGWLYCKALPADEFVAYCRRRNAGRISTGLSAVA